MCLALNQIGKLLRRDIVHDGAHTDMSGLDAASDGCGTFGGSFPFAVVFALIFSVC